MHNIRVTKIFRFEMAHALDGHDGPCRHLHGHSYVLEVCLLGRPNTDSASPKQGMVVDFADFKHLVNSLIMSRFDHTVAVRQGSATHLHLEAEAFERLLPLPFQPTCENLLAHFADLIAPALPQGVSLHHLRLHETASAFAEWYASDNPT